MRNSHSRNPYVWNSTARNSSSMIRRSQTLIDFIIQLAKWILLFRLRLPSKVVSHPNLFFISSRSACFFYFISLASPAKMCLCDLHRCPGRITASQSLEVTFGLPLTLSLCGGGDFTFTFFLIHILAWQLFSTVLSALQWPLILSIYLSSLCVCLCPRGVSMIVYASLS